MPRLGLRPPAHGAEHGRKRDVRLRPRAVRRRAPARLRRAWRRGRPRRRPRSRTRDGSSARARVRCTRARSAGRARPRPRTATPPGRAAPRPAGTRVPRAEVQVVRDWVVGAATRVHDGRHGGGRRRVGAPGVASERGRERPDDGPGELGRHAEDVAAVGRVRVGPAHQPRPRVGEAPSPGRCDPARRTAPVSTAATPTCGPPPARRRPCRGRRTRTCAPPPAGRAPWPVPSRARPSCRRRSRTAPCRRPRS